MTRPGSAMTGGVVTIDDVRRLVAGLPRSYEAHVRGRVKFRVGRIVYLAFSKDEKEGTFFEVGDTIISVYAKTEYFSRDKPA